MLNTLKERTHAFPSQVEVMPEAAVEPLVTPISEPVVENVEPVVVTPVVRNIPPLPEFTIPSLDIDSLVSAHIAKYVEMFKQKYTMELEIRIAADVEVAYNNFMAEIDGNIKSEVERRFKQKLSASTLVKPKTTPTLKVMILGLHSDQEFIIRKEYDSHLKLVFMHTDAPSKNVQNLKNGCDYIVVMTKFISHNKYEIIKDHKGIRMINGGMTELKNLLLELSFI